MTAVLPGVSGAAQSSGAPADVARARVAVMVASYQVDVVVPVKFAIEAFIDDLIAVLRQAIDGEVDFTPPTGQWTLARPGQVPFPRWRTLADHDVDDGTTLMLCTVESAEVFTPIVEDVTDALALINDREFAEFDAPTAALAGLTAWVLGTAAVAALLTWSWMHTAETWWYATAALVVGGLCWAAALVAVRVFDSPRLCLGLAVSAVPPLFVGGFMLVPPAFGDPGRITAGNIAAGAAIATVAAATMIRMTRLGIATLTAVTALGLLATLGLIPLVFLNLSLPQAIAGLLLAGVMLLASAPRIAIALATVRPPDLPDPGDQVEQSTLTDIFEAETDVEPEPDLDARKKRAESAIERRARLAVTTLRGLIIAASSVVAISAVSVCVLSPGGIRELVIAAAATGVLVLRSRWFPDRVQSLAFLTAAAAIVVGVGAESVFTYPSISIRLSVLGAVLGVALAACVAGGRLPGVRLSPVTRRVVDLVEYALLVVIPVIAFWLMGVYTAMRQI